MESKHKHARYLEGIEKPETFGNQVKMDDEEVFKFHGSWKPSADGQDEGGARDHRMRGHISVWVCTLSEDKSDAAPEACG